MHLGPRGLAIGGIDIGDHRRITATPWPIIAGIGPDLAGLRSLAPGIEHGSGGLVGKQPLGSSQSLEDVVAQGAQIPRCASDPVCKGGAVKLDVLPGIDLGLPVERQVIGILGDQHLRDQRFGGDAAFDDPCRRRSLNNRVLARAAAIARAAGERALLQSLGHQAQARSVPPDQLDPIGTLGAEHIDHAGIWLAAILGRHQRGERVRSLPKIHGPGCHHHLRAGHRADHCDARRAVITAAIVSASAPLPILTTVPPISSSTGAGPAPPRQNLPASQSLFPWRRSPIFQRH
jgi:hypothetical protein